MNERPYWGVGRHSFVKTALSLSNWIVPFDSTTAEVCDWP
jgi:hypothetical protein